MNKLYGENLIKLTKMWQDKTCYWCGEFLKANEKAYLIVPLCEYKRLYKSLSGNLIIHKEEWETLKETFPTEEELFEFLGKYKPPKKSKKPTELQLERLEIFKQVAREAGFSIETKKKFGVSMKIRGSSDRLDYNVYTEIFLYFNKRKSGIFDSLFERELEAKLSNRFHKLLGDKIHDDFSATDVINKAVKTANEIMK